MEFTPLKFSNIFKEKIWGGSVMRMRLGKAVRPGAKVGESWELSEHENGTSVIREGAFKGKALSDIVRRYPGEILGGRIAKVSRKVPLLFKFIDANDKLSIQVHPGDAWAKKHEGDSGKTEAWYVVHARPGAKLICGLKKRLTPARVRRGLGNGNLEKDLREFRVKTGDCIFVPAGTVHAIEAGVLIYEVQEVSDVTYRLYDWDRTGDGGRPRNLHVEESLKVMDFSDTRDHRTRPVKIKSQGCKREVLAGCEYFVMEKYYITGCAARDLPGRFEVMTVVSGKGTISCSGRRVPVRRGETVLLPAALKRYEMEKSGPDFTCILTWVPAGRKAAVRELTKLGVTKTEMKTLGGLA